MTKQTKSPKKKISGGVLVEKFILDSCYYQVPFFISKKDYNLHEENSDGWYFTLNINKYK